MRNSNGRTCNYIGYYSYTFRRFICNYRRGTPYAVRDASVYGSWNTFFGTWSIRSDKKRIGWYVVEVL